MTSSGYVWVEKYRPKIFEDIVLDPLNKQILKNIIETSYFPNLLFYGPPGTGKTTTIINLINAYQEKLNKKNKDLIIHLNASDERGIDIIRNQISCFVNSKPLFHTGMKFVILDEVDYMTKNAQQALRYLLQNYSNNVRFCLICNYISKIDEGLQNEFIKLRFNQLPKDEIILYLANIVQCEKINLSIESLHFIQNTYKSDVRSMINYIQSIQNSQTNHVINDAIFEELYKRLITPSESLSKLTLHITKLSSLYNIDSKNIIKHYLNFIIRSKPQLITASFLSTLENAMHCQDCSTDCFINYILTKMMALNK